MPTSTSCIASSISRIAFTRWPPLSWAAFMVGWLACAGSAPIKAAAGARMDTLARERRCVGLATVRGTAWSSDECWPGPLASHTIKCRPNRMQTGRVALGVHQRGHGTARSDQECRPDHTAAGPWHRIRQAAHRRSASRSESALIGINTSSRWLSKNRVCVQSWIGFPHIQGGKVWTWHGLGGRSRGRVGGVGAGVPAFTLLLGGSGQGSPAQGQRRREAEEQEEGEEKEVNGRSYNENRGVRVQANSSMLLGMIGRLVSSPEWHPSLSKL
ncbi:hypothetical protein IFHNHDMJ_00608 [Synechococcus sp. CBW1107]|nr:hypothetical protein IFHNHDMJ_00608 [Synechococcus sp. CBW1107]